MTQMKAIRIAKWGWGSTSWLNSVIKALAWSLGSSWFSLENLIWKTKEKLIRRKNEVQVEGEAGWSHLFGVSPIPTLLCSTTYNRGSESKHCVSRLPYQTVLLGSVREADHLGGRGAQRFFPCFFPGCILRSYDSGIVSVAATTWSREHFLDGWDLERNRWALSTHPL